MYYVYQYLDPLTNAPLYIGKGQRDRLNDHWKLIQTGRKTTNKHWTAKLNQLRSLGLIPIIEKIKENLTSEEALLIEEGLIAKYGRRDYDEGGILYNHLKKSNDWTGAKHSAESKIKIGLAHKNKKLEDWHIEAIKKANTGKIKSKETLEKMSIAQRGIPKSEAAKQKMSITAKAKPRSELQKQAFALAAQKAHSREARQKQAASMKGKKHSPETIAKMSAKAKLRWAKTVSS